MRFIYSTGITFYYLFLRIAGVFSTKARAWHYGRKELFDKLEEVFTAHHANSQPSPVAWFHCASLGEFEQGRPVIEAFRNKFPGYTILLTFFSPSGYDHKKQYKGADHVFYLPIDTRLNARKFIAIVRPQFAIFVKYEFWFNYLFELFKNHVPVFTISAIFRPNQHFFKWYGGWFRTHLRRINRVFVQDEESAELLRMIDVENICISGDTRFDRVKSIKAIQQPYPLIDSFTGGKHIIVAGSTWPPDNELLLALYERTGDQLKFIIAPHEMNLAYIREFAGKLGDKAVLYSEAPGSDLKKKQFLIIDSIGMLSQLYRYASIAYIGGGFGAGIHNTLEAAAYGVPVFFGPNYLRFREAREMIDAGVAFSVQNVNELTLGIVGLLSNQTHLENVSHKAGEYVSSKTGATDIIIEELSNMIASGQAR
ncbi:MAG: 3-deoxy-D-manno-octulosonic acid transferase [Bacteroidales bacterium]|nr:3-deoxy-D-manno-octulosonic acid transferase [Bacteroidales bacterium]